LSAVEFMASVISFYCW